MDEDGNEVGYERDPRAPVGPPQLCEECRYAEMPEEARPPWALTVVLPVRVGEEDED